MPSPSTFIKTAAGVAGTAFTVSQDPAVRRAAGATASRVRSAASGAADGVRKRVHEETAPNGVKEFVTPERRERTLSLARQVVRMGPGGYSTPASYVSDVNEALRGLMLALGEDPDEGERK